MVSSSDGMVLWIFGMIQFLVQLKDQMRMHVLKCGHAAYHVALVSNLHYVLLYVRLRDCILHWFL